jgi:hypothetical protein
MVRIDQPNSKTAESTMAFQNCEYGFQDARIVRAKRRNTNVGDRRVFQSYSVEALLSREHNHDWNDFISEFLVQGLRLGHK